MDNDRGKALLEKFANYAAKALEGDPRFDWKQAVQDCYRQFGLYKDSQGWTLPELEQESAYLLPEDLNFQTLSEFIFSAVHCLKENPYLIRFLDRLPEDGSGIFGPEANRPGQMFYLFAFGLCLERLNCLARNDLAVLEALIKHFRRERKKKKFYRLSNILAAVKLHSIELPLVLFIKAFKKSRAGHGAALSPNFGKIILSVNIFEAFLVDFFSGLFKNAFASLPLIVFNPNFKAYLPGLKNYKKGAPSSFSLDRKGALLFAPSPKEWADLYQVWNAAFVARFRGSPYLLMKLAIPSVSGYQKQPAAYMHTRITALLLTLTYLDAAVKSPKIPVEVGQLGPINKKALLLWGEINLVCAKKYVNGIKLKT